MIRMVKNLLAMRETWVRSLGWEDPLEKTINGYPFQYSGLENSMDRGVWLSTIHASGKESDMTEHLTLFTFAFHPEPVP